MVPGERTSHRTECSLAHTHTHLSKSLAKWSEEYYQLAPEPATLTPLCTEKSFQKCRQQKRSLWKRISQGEPEEIRSNIMSQHDGGGALTVNSRRLREIQEEQREKGRHLHHSMRALIHLNHQAAHQLPQAERCNVKPQGIFQSMLLSPGGLWLWVHRQIQVFSFYWDISLQSASRFFQWI